MFYRDRIILILLSREHCVLILARIRCSRIIALVSLGGSLGAGSSRGALGILFLGRALCSIPPLSHFGLALYPNRKSTIVLF